MTTYIQHVKAVQFTHETDIRELFKTLEQFETDFYDFKFIDNIDEGYIVITYYGKDGFESDPLEFKLREGNSWIVEYGKGLIDTVFNTDFINRFSKVESESQ